MGPNKAPQKPRPAVGKQHGSQLALCSCENAFHFPWTGLSLCTRLWAVTTQSLCAKEPAPWDSGTARISKSLAGQEGGHLYLLVSAEVPHSVGVVVWMWKGPERGPPAADSVTSRCCAKRESLVGHCGRPR